MKEKLLIETEVGREKIVLYHFDSKTEKSTEIKDNIEDGAKLFECSESLVEALTYLCEQINEMRGAIEMDLTDLYKEIKAVKDK